MIDFCWMNPDLVTKYNVPGPRYTSYPTVPHWETSAFDVKEWEGRLMARSNETKGHLSIYVHLPYCESLCTYCGCNTRITRNHQVEESYVEALLAEWKMYLDTMPEKPVIEALHLGGGTPTFFSAQNLKRLVSEILDTADLVEKPELSFEGHPANTTEEHLQTLAAVGFNRVSFGIQDFDDKIQQLINRKQKYEEVQEVVELARKWNYESINFDLIYGLPGQNRDTIADTIEKTILLNPDRIAFYSYAHVPKLKPAQKSYESFLPEPSLKADLYRLGKTLLKASRYVEIGMDHFAKESDELYESFQSGTLHRNFMGYTTKSSKLLVGLGASSIGDVWTGFNQNKKNVEEYLSMVQGDQWPISRGHLHSELDVIVRQKILDLMCRYETSWTEEEGLLLNQFINYDLLDELESDGLVERDFNRIFISSRGRPFVRNICMALDAHLSSKAGVATTFSKTV